MKKIICTLLAVTMFGAFATACKAKVDESGKATDATEATENGESTAEATEETEEETTAASSSEHAEFKAKLTNMHSSTCPTVEEQVLLDESDVKIVLIDYVQITDENKDAFDLTVIDSGSKNDLEDYGNYEAAVLYLENNSDTDLWIQYVSARINGTPGILYSSNTLICECLKAHSSTYGFVDITEPAFYDICEVGELEITFAVEDADTYDNVIDDFSRTFKTSFYGKDSTDITKVDGAQFLGEKDGYKVWGYYVGTESIDGSLEHRMVFVFDNGANGDKKADFALTVNGVEITGGDYTYYEPQKDKMIYAVDVTPYLEQDGAAPITEVKCKITLEGKDGTIEFDEATYTK